MTPALSAALAAARAAYADFGAKLEAIVMLLAAQPVQQEEPPPVVVDPPPGEVEPPPEVEPPAAAGFKLTVQANGSLLITGVEKITWTLVKNSEAESWPWYGERHTDVPVPADGLVIPIQPVENDTDFVKVLYALPDGSMGAEDGPKTWKAPASPVVTQPPVTSGGRTAVNLLLRGQSNAYLFKDWGGLDQLVEKLEAALPIKVKILADFDNSDGAASIHSGTAFLNWDSDGEQKSLLAFIGQQSAAVRKQPTVTIWMHNEYEQQGAGTEAQWLTEFNADRKLVAAAFGQAASSLPIVFTPVPYNYGGNRNWLTAMRKLAAEPAQNCTVVDAFAGALMDGDGQPNSSHMGRGDQALVANALVAPLKSIFGNMLTPANAAPPVVTVPPVASGTSAAQAFLDTHKGMGVNYERDRIRRMKLDKAYFQTQRGVGVTHGRYFPPYRWNVQMGWTGVISDTQIDDWLSRVGFSIEAGMAAYVDMFDVMAAGELADNWGTCKDYITRFSKRIAARGWTPLQIAVGPFNELEGGKNGDFNKYRLEAHALIRAQLPKHVIVHGACGWNGIGGWEDGNWALPPDDNVLGQVHGYFAPGAENWAKREAQFKDMGAKLRNMPFVLAEVGGDFQHVNFEQDGGRWVQLFKDIATNAPSFRPTLWAMSGEGSALRLNRGADDPRLQPLIETCIKECSTIIKSKLG